jgi:uncharacterized protein YjaG (DUF416 family)
MPSSVGTTPEPNGHSSTNRHSNNAPARNLPSLTMHTTPGTHPASSDEHSILPFNEHLLVPRLEAMDPWRRTVFAALCAIRLLPAYNAFNAATGQGDPTTLLDSLSTLRVDLASATLSDTDLCTLISRCTDLVPDADDASWNTSSHHTANAAASVAYALRSRLTGDTRHAVLAALQAYETADTLAIERHHLDLNTPGVDLIILSDPIVQTELHRQASDLATLERLTHSPDLPALSTLWHRAETHSILDPC